MRGRGLTNENEKVERALERVGEGGRVEEGDGEPGERATGREGSVVDDEDPAAGGKQLREGSFEGERFEGKVGLLGVAQELTGHVPLGTGDGPHVAHVVGFGENEEVEVLRLGEETLALVDDEMELELDIGRVVEAWLLRNVPLDDVLGEVVQLG